jgi:branched-chain amino acid transport system substrate-binding protein
MRRQVHRSRSFAMLLAAAAMVGLGASACSSGSSSASGSSTSTTASSGAKPWVIATVGTLSGSQGSEYGGCSVAMQAWASSVNAAGGIDGHPVDLIVKDDQGSGPIALSEVQDLWQNQHVDAIVSSCTNFDSAWMPYAIKNGIPIIGGQADDTFWGSSKYVFPDATGFPTFNYSVAKAVQAAGAKNFGVAYCAESPACLQGVPAIASSAQALGLSLSWKGEVAGTDTSYTAQCLASKQAGAKVLLVEGVQGVFPRFVSDCTQQGYTPYYLSSGFSTTPDLPTTPGLNNHLIGIMLTFPWVQDNTPATQAFHAAMNKYQSSSSEANTPSTAVGWLSAQIFEYAAQHVQGNPSTAALLTSMWSIRNQTFGGLMPATSFTDAPNPASKCFTFVGVTDDKYSLPFGSTFSCQP